MMIRPSADLRNKYGEMSKICKETMSPIEITINGKEDTVLLSHTLYHQQMAELELLKILAEAENDILNGRVRTMDEAFDEMLKELQARLIE